LKIKRVPGKPTLLRIVNAALPGGEMSFPPEITEFEVNDNIAYIVLSYENMEPITPGTKVVPGK